MSLLSDKYWLQEGENNGKNSGHARNADYIEFSLPKRDNQLFKINLIIVNIWRITHQKSP
jgi:hypothetical protein